MKMDNKEESLELSPENNNDDEDEEDEDDCHRARRLDDALDQPFPCSLRSCLHRRGRSP